MQGKTCCVTGHRDIPEEQIDDVNSLWSGKLTARHAAACKKRQSFAPAIPDRLP